MKVRPLRNAITCSILFLAFAGLDYVTGYEVTSFPLYLVPIALSFFYFGKLGGYFSVVVAVSLWLTNDILTGHRYEVDAVRYWNLAVRMLTYLLFVYGLSHYAKTLETHRRRLEDLRRILPMCHGCGRVLWKDGTWKHPSEALAAAVSSVADFPECPGCVVVEGDES